MVIKIIFSDFSTVVLKSRNSDLSKELKSADNDNQANKILDKYKESYEVIDESDGVKDECMIDLRKKKQSQTKKMLKAFGGKHKGY